MCIIMRLQENYSEHFCTYSQNLPGNAGHGVRGDGPRDSCADHTMANLSLKRG